MALQQSSVRLPTQASVYHDTDWPSPLCKREGWGISVDLMAMVGLTAASGAEFTACWEVVITLWKHNGAFDVSRTGFRNTVDLHFLYIHT